MTETVKEMGRSELVRRVYDERMRVGLSHRDLSKLTGVSFSTLARVERGDGEYSDETSEKLEAWLDGREWEPGPLDETKKIATAAAVAIYDQIMAMHSAQSARLEAQDAEIERLRGACDVMAERERQKTVEGWAPEHDDEHDDGSLVLAAVSYALSACGRPNLTETIDSLGWTSAQKMADAWNTRPAPKDAP